MVKITKNAKNLYTLNPRHNKIVENCPLKNFSHERLLLLHAIYIYSTAIEITHYAITTAIILVGSFWMHHYILKLPRYRIDDEVARSRPTVV